MVELAKGDCVCVSVVTGFVDGALVTVGLYVAIDGDLVSLVVGAAMYGSCKYILKHRL